MRPDLIPLQVGADQPDAAVGHDHAVGDEVVRTIDREVVDVSVVRGLFDRDDIVVQEAERLQLLHLLQQELLVRNEAERYPLPRFLIVMPFDETRVNILIGQECLDLFELQPLLLQLLGPSGRLDPAGVELFLEQHVLDGNLGLSALAL